MHLCVLSDFLNESFQDYFALSCEVATKTGTPLFSSGIFWTGTVSPQPPALSLAHPCLCQIPLEPSSAHLLKENTTKHQLFFFFFSKTDYHGQHRWNTLSLSPSQTQPWQRRTYWRKNQTWDQFQQTQPTESPTPSQQQPVTAHW